MIAKDGGNFREAVCDDTSEIVTQSLKEERKKIDKGEGEGQCDLMMLAEGNDRVKFSLICLTQSKC